MDLKEAKLNIYREFLSRVVDEGYSLATLKKTVIDNNYNEAMTEILFPGGIADIFTMLFESKYRLVLDEVEQGSLQDLRVKDRIKFLVLRLFEHLAEHKAAIRIMIKTIYNPELFIKNLKITWYIVDEFWRMSGDKSTDFNFYSKRFLLSCVYLPSLLYWLGDSRSGHDVENFLDNLLTRVNKIGKIKSLFSQGLKLKNIPIIRMFRK